MLDVMTIHCGKQFLAYGLLMLGYGQMGRVMQIMEENRWAGPARYIGKFTQMNNKNDGCKSDSLDLI